MLMMVVGDTIERCKREQKEAEKNERRYGICRECQGSGEIEESEYNDATERLEYTTKICPRCNGTGKVK